jgi:gas vesicle protein
MSTTSKVILGVLGAAAAGLAIGLLIAPEKGSEMRKRLGKTAGGWADGLSHLFVKGQEELENMKNKASHAKTVAEEKVSRAKESLG